jgi:hypothetical protein
LESNRTCPGCSERTIPVKRLLLANVHWCGVCGSQVKAQWLYGAIFNILIVVVTLFSTIVVHFGHGFYAAMLLLPLPLGAIGYLKARYCQLEAVRPEVDTRDAS